MKHSLKITQGDWVLSMQSRSDTAELCVQMVGQGVDRCGWLLHTGARPWTARDGARGAARRASGASAAAGTGADGDADAEDVHQEAGPGALQVANHLRGDQVGQSIPGAG